MNAIIAACHVPIPPPSFITAAPMSGAPGGTRRTLSPMIVIPFPVASDRPSDKNSELSDNGYQFGLQSIAYISTTTPPQNQIHFRASGARSSTSSSGEDTGTPAVV